MSLNFHPSQVDSDLQRLQALMLDVAASLLELKHHGAGGGTVSRDPKEMIHDALHLLGNTMAQASRMRRKRVLKTCYPNKQRMKASLQMCYQTCLDRTSKKNEGESRVSEDPLKEPPGSHFFPERATTPIPTEVVALPSGGRGAETLTWATAATETPLLSREAAAGG